MTESTKTLSLIGAAVFLAVVAALTRPHISSGEAEGQKGQLLFPEWKDPVAAKSLAITSVDETTSKLDEFKVADVDGKWVVPSHDNYPANAEDKVVRAASSIIGLHVLDVKGDNPGDQELYGVVEPNEKTLTTSSFSGFGRLVVVKDAEGKDLARLVVSKEIKSPGEIGSSNLHWVRRAGQDRIYVVSLDTDVLTTKFQDWVDTDILGMKQPWDVVSLALRDYTIERSLVRKSDIDLSFAEKNAAWSLNKLTDYSGIVPKVLTSLPAGEELDSGKINEVKTDISGMKLTDVERKPAAVAELLKSGKPWMADPAVNESFSHEGFITLPERDPTDVFGLGGDLTVGMKDGVEYSIRFGGAVGSLKSDSGEKDKKDDASKDKDKDKNKKKSNLERFVFVTARFNQDLIPKPELQSLPEVNKPAKDAAPPKTPEPNKTEPKATEPAKAAPQKTDDKTPAPARKPDEKTPEKSGAKPADATKGGQASAHLAGELLALADTADEAKKPAATATADDKKLDDAKKPADAKSGAEAKAEPKKPADAKTPDKPAEPPTAAKAPDAGKPADKAKPPEAAKPAEAKPESDISRAEKEQAAEAERKRIDTENRRKQDEYDETVKKGRAHAKELNARFAEWYYLISEDEYKKMHVGLSELVKAKPGSDAALPQAPTNPFDTHGLKLPHP